MVSRTPYSPKAASTKAASTVETVGRTYSTQTEGGEMPLIAQVRLSGHATITSCQWPPPTPSLVIRPPGYGTSINQCSDLDALGGKKLLLILGIIIFICVFSCMCLCCCYSICLQCSQTALKRAASRLLKPPADNSGRTLQMQVVGASHKGRPLEEVIERSWPPTDPSRGSSLPPLTLELCSVHRATGGSDCKVSAYNAGDLGSTPRPVRSSRERNGKPLQYSCLENPMDGGAW